jgi:uncharacterized protein YkwD
MTDVAVVRQTVGRLGINDHRIDVNTNASRFPTGIAPKFCSGDHLDGHLPQMEPAAFSDTAPLRCHHARKNDTSSRAYRSRAQQQMKPLSAILLSLTLLFGGMAAAKSSPAELISDFRLKHGEGRVTMDATLNGIALDQAKAMAAKDTLDHEVLGSFSSRITRAKAGRAAENIAYGYDSFEKTLDQWIASAGHRKNLLLPNASRIGVASVQSPTSHRTYWAMEIAGDYEPPPTVAGKKTRSATKRKTSAQSCRATILGVCF